MRANKLKSIWADGHVSLNGWLHIPSGWSAEVMAHQGYDSLTVDLQHGLMGLDTAISMLQAISTTDVTPLARVPWNEPGIIMKLLDMGAYGIICPMINDRQQCEKFVASCRYYPDGYRSLGPTRARIYGGNDYVQHANRQIVTMAMIETVAAVTNVEDIVSVTGLDAIYIGPGDLSLTLGSSQLIDNDDPQYLAALDKVLSACRQHHIAAGIHTNEPDYARRMIVKGFQFVTVMTDTTLLGTMARQMVTAVRPADDQTSSDIPGSAY